MRLTPKNQVARAACITICTLGCLALLAIIILVIIVAATLKIPEVTLSRVVLAPNQQISFDTALQSKLKIAWQVTANVKNANFYDIYLSDVNVKSEFKSLPDQTVATGAVQDKTLPGNDVTTSLVLPVNVEWDPAQPQNNKLVQQFINACGTGGAGKLSMVYKVDVWAKVYGLGPVKIPTIIREADTDCPASLNIGNVLRQLGIRA